MSIVTRRLVTVDGKDGKPAYDLELIQDKEGTIITVTQRGFRLKSPRVDAFEFYQVVQDLAQGGQNHSGI